MTPEGIGLSAAQMAEVFPFHLAFGPDLQILQSGPVLQRLCPGLAGGGELGNHFVIRRPAHITSFAEICAQNSSLFILEARQRALLLRGQVIQLGPSAAAFLGSPWVTSISELETLDLSLHEFAIHDPIADLLILLQAKDRILADAQQLAQELRSARRDARLG